MIHSYLAYLYIFFQDFLLKFECYWQHCFTQKIWQSVKMEKVRIKKCKKIFCLKSPNSSRKINKKIALSIFTFSIFTLRKWQSKATQPLAHYYHNSNFPNFYRWLDTIIHITPPQNDIDTIILLNFSASFLTFLYSKDVFDDWPPDRRNISSPISILKVNIIFSPLWTKEISACAFSL